MVKIVKIEVDDQEEEGPVSGLITFDVNGTKVEVTVHSVGEIDMEVEGGRELTPEEEVELFHILHNDTEIEEAFPQEDYD